MKDNNYVSRELILNIKILTDELIDLNEQIRVINLKKDNVKNALKELNKLREKDYE